MLIRLSQPSLSIEYWIVIGDSLPGFIARLMKRRTPCCWRSIKYSRKPTPIVMTNLPNPETDYRLHTFRAFVDAFPVKVGLYELSLMAAAWTGAMELMQREASQQESNLEEEIT